MESGGVGISSVSSLRLRGDLPCTTWIDPSGWMLIPGVNRPVCSSGTCAGSVRWSWSCCSVGAFRSWRVFSSCTRAAPPSCIGTSSVTTSSSPDPPPPSRLETWASPRSRRPRSPRASSVRTQRAQRASRVRSVHDKSFNLEIHTFHQIQKPAESALDDHIVNSRCVQGPQSSWLQRCTRRSTTRPWTSTPSACASWRWRRPSIHTPSVRTPPRSTAKSQA